MKVFVLTKRKISAVCLYLALAVLVVYGMGYGISIATGSSQKLIPIYCVETEKKQIALTFDAAWGAQDTDALIAVLKQYNAKATFFVLGEWADKNPESIKKFDQAGHYIASHSYTHNGLSRMDRSAILEQLSSCNEKIKSITGKENRLFRAPSGDYNNNVVEVATSLGMYTIQWSLDSLDYKGLSEKEMYDRIVPKVKNGDIILFHNDVENTPKALPAILAALQNEGYSFVTVEELIYKENYTIDHAGEQKQNPS